MDIHIAHPSLAMPTTAQVRGLRTIGMGSDAFISARTIRSLFAAQWVTSTAMGYALTAAGRAALARFAP